MQRPLLMVLAALTVLGSLPAYASAEDEVPPWWDAGWRFRDALTLREPAGIGRVWEPVLVRIALPADRVNNPSSELRVLTWLNGWVEIPFQILAWARKGDEVVVELAFLANASPYSAQTYYVYYGNPQAPDPSYSTDLRVDAEAEGVTVSNSYYELTLSTKKGGGLSRILVKGINVNLASNLSGEASFQFEYRAGGKEYRQALGKLRRLEVASAGPVLARVIVETQVWNFNVTQEWYFFAYNPYIWLKLRVEGTAPSLEWIRYFNTRFDALAVQLGGFDSWFIDGGSYRVSALQREDFSGAAFAAALASSGRGVAVGVFRLDQPFWAVAGWARELKWEVGAPADGTVEDLFLYAGPLHEMLSYRERLKSPLTPEMWQRRAPAFKPLNTEEVLSEASFVVFLIPHSHWDPDWLMPWSESSEKVRSIIASAAKLAVAQPGFKFVVDQVCFLRYFWERASEAEREFFKEAVRRGAIEIAGGMVSQPDTNLVSEPGLVWDAFLGRRWTMENLGVEPSPVAWQCDPFGHAPTLPEFLVASGYRYVYFGRCGEGQEGWLPHAFWWVGPTGARVLAYFRDYCAGEFLSRAGSADEVVSRILEIVEEARRRDGIGAAILLVGCDFTPPPIRLVDLVSDWNQRYLTRTGVGLVIATPSEAFRFIEERYGGRLREIKLDPNPLWQGWYITRPSAKLVERRASMLLSTITKLLPLAALAGLNTSWIAEQAASIWFDLCVNHHHDSITGTSPDSTWKGSIWPRYAGALASAERLHSEFIARLAESIGGRSLHSIVVFNPSARTRSGIVFVNATLRSGISSLVAIDEEGVHPVQILGARPLNVTHSIYELAVDVGRTPPLGYKTLELVEGGLQVQSPASARIEGGKAVLENAYVRLVVNVEKGGLIEELVDKVSGSRLLRAPSGEILFYRDWGDVYGFSLGSPVAVSRAFSVAKAEVVWSGPLVAKLLLQLKGATDVQLEYTVCYDVRGVDLSVTVAALKDTTAVLALSGIAGRVVRGAPFGAVEGGDARFWPVAYWFAIEPLRGPSLLVINRGAAQGVRFLVGSVEIGLTRDCSTPKADKITFTDQDWHTIELRLLAYSGGWRDNLVWLEAYDFNNPLVAVVVTPDRAKLPPRFGLLSANWGAELVDALPLQDWNVLTFSNYLPTRSITLYTALEVAGALSSLIDGRPLSPLQPDEAGVVLPANASLVSALVKWGPRLEPLRPRVATLRLSLVNASGMAIEVGVSLRGEDGEPLPGRILRLLARSDASKLEVARALTDAEGRARITLELNASGPLELYAVFDGDLLYGASESNSVVVEVVPVFRFSVLVLDPLGDPLPGARVTITGAGRTVFTRTDEHGVAEALLAPGTYRVSVTYADAVETLYVQVSGVASIEVKLSSLRLLLSLPKIRLAIIAVLFAALLAAALLRLVKARER
ncbi:MAG: hypothetical protein QXH81_09355 [Thermofilaceae archaeon]